MTDASVEKRIDLGSGHRAVRLDLCIAPRRRRKKYVPKKCSVVGWEPTDATRYADMLDKKLADVRVAERLDWLERSIDEKLVALEQIVSEAAHECRTVPAKHGGAQVSMPTDLMERRRQLRSSDEGVTGISKEIQKQIRKQLRALKRQQISERLSEFKNLQRIGHIRDNGRRNLLQSVFDKHGVLRDGRQEIVDVFADFYSDLYSMRKPAEATDLEGETEAAEPFTVDEAVGELKKMAKKKASDTAGLVVEMIQHCSRDFLKTIVGIFNQILQPTPLTPSSWKEATVKLLYKKGDPKQPENYRPITLLSILYKLFSRMLGSRIKVILDREQSSDQAGFRPGYSVDDHLFTVVMLVEKLNEYQQPLWICAVDFRKAFDTVEHDQLWSAMLAQGVPPVYVRTLAALYHDQVGKIVADMTSKCFEITRGTKQGDPLSPQLFNSVLEQAFRNIQNEWRRRGWGIQLGEGRDHLLCNLRFADDVLLVARSRRQLASMIEDLIDATRRVGLELHPDKSKILHNEFADNRGAKKYVEVMGQRIDIVETVMYLGRKLKIKDLHATEVDNRISKAWAKFISSKKELCTKHYPLRDRLRLFQATVSSTLLYGSGSWTMTAAMQTKLRATQRRMLRWIMSVGRKTVHSSTWDQTSSSDTTSTSEDGDQEAEGTDTDDNDLDEDKESWLDWIKRATSIAESQLKKAGIDDWVTAQRRRKYKWAGHVSRRCDGRWSTRALNWIPVDGVRKVGHPRKRWIDEIVQYFECLSLGSEGWLFAAADRKTWEEHENLFLSVRLYLM